MIGLGRLLLAILYVLAILFDASQPARGAIATYALLAAYLAFAAVTVAMTWNDWWLDAKVAGSAHAIDIAFFTLLVALTAGYTSPFFTFFVFVLLSAAIRWGWRATALTAVLLILLHLAAGVLAATSAPQVEIQRFGVRTGQLVILSLILIWFGASRWNFPARSTRDLPVAPALDQMPLEAALRTLINRLDARSGAFLWRTAGQDGFVGGRIQGGETSSVQLSARALRPAAAASPFLYDLDEDRCLTRDPARNLIESCPADYLEPQAGVVLALREGLAIPVISGDGAGELFLEGIRGLSTDHIDLGEQLAVEVAAQVQSHELLQAAEERAEARSRLTLARDLHDGVVQFLAATAFRLEAMRRSQGTGRDLAPDLDELKQLILQEQHELRTFITALRSGPVVTFDDLARDLKALAGRLAQQWGVICTFSSRPSGQSVPARHHLDAQQLVREAVANAVRHAGAKSISIALTARNDELRLKVINDGAPPRAPGGLPQVPVSLKERVEHAGGSLDIARGMDVTKITIVLPIARRAM